MSDRHPPNEAYDETIRELRGKVIDEDLHKEAARKMSVKWRKHDDKRLSEHRAAIINAHSILYGADELSERGEAALAVLEEVFE